jgi:uncharacterized protein (DUF1499 family)
MPVTPQDHSASRQPSGWNARLVVIALALVTIALLLAVLSGFGHRLGWWHFRTGFQLLRWGVYLAIAGCAVSGVTLLVAVLRRRLRETFAAGVVFLVAVGVISVPLQWLNLARSVPPIHDITTDMHEPPAFEAILPLRADAPNSAEYAGEEIAAQQRDAYPDIVPLELDAGVDEAYAAALATARDMGWEIIAADAGRGRIEAVATTFWFGFRDDVVVRVSARDAGTRIDVRSVSRVGRSDAGANALRIRTYLDRLESRLSRAAAG